MPNRRISGHLLLSLAISPLLLGAACEKKKPTTDTGAMGAIDRANEQSGPVDKTPLQGIDTSKLEAGGQELFYKLMGSLNSPCGKGHNLRTSFTQDQGCKRAPYAVRYVLALVGDEAKESDVREFYKNKYEKAPSPVKLDTSKAPRVGNDDAPVRLVEFFDYQCPHCAAFAPVMDKVAETHKGKVVQYFMMYPLLEGKHPGSKSAAQAAYAAYAQGKFKEMHHKLFQSAGALSKDHVTRYAAELGLDVAKFQADYDAAAALVAKDEAQAQGADVHATPTLFFNDRKYEGPQDPEYIGMWIDEELAVNR